MALIHSPGTSKCGTMTHTRAGRPPVVARGRARTKTETASRVCSLFKILWGPPIVWGKIGAGLIAGHMARGHSRGPMTQPLLRGWRVQRCTRSLSILSSLTGTMTASAGYRRAI
jgi:hypothetical protein